MSSLQDFVRRLRLRMKKTNPGFVIEERITNYDHRNQ